MISGRTTLIGHLGYPTESFKAPLIYNPWFETAGIDAVVVPMGIKTETYRPVVLLWDWVGYIFSSDRREVFGVGVMLLIFGCMSCIVAAVIAWPLQALIVVLRRGKRGLE